MTEYNEVELRQTIEHQKVRIAELEELVRYHEEQARATLRGYGIVVDQREAALAEVRRLRTKLSRRSRALVRSLNRERAALGKPPLDLS